MPRVLGLIWRRLTPRSPSRSEITGWGSRPSSTVQADLAWRGCGNAWSGSVGPCASRAVPATAPACRPEYRAELSSLHECADGDRRLRQTSAAVGNECGPKMVFVPGGTAREPTVTGSTYVVQAIGASHRRHRVQVSNLVGGQIPAAELSLANTAAQDEQAGKLTSGEWIRADGSRRAAEPIRQVELAGFACLGC